MLDEVEIRITGQVLDIPHIAGHQIVETDHSIPFGEEAVSQVRTEETCGSGHDGGLFVDAHGVSAGEKWRGVWSQTLIAQAKTPSLAQSALRSCARRRFMAEQRSKFAQLSPAAPNCPVPDMRFPITQLLLASLAALLTSCGPSDEDADDPFAQHNKQMQKRDENSGMTFLPPEEIMRTFGIRKQENRREVVFLQSLASSPYQRYQKTLLTILVSRESGYLLTTLDAQAKSALQVEQLREAISRKPSAIILSPIADSPLEIAVAEAVQAGIPVISLDARVRDGVTLVHTSPEAIGKAAATLVLDAMKRKAADEGKPEPGGRIVQLRSTEAADWSGRVAAAFEAALKTQPGAILVHDAPAEATADDVHRRLGEARRIQQQYDVIFCHSDAIARFASANASLVKNREDTLIIGTGALPGRNEGLELLHNTDIDATVSRPPLIDLALRILVKKNQDTSFQPKAEYEVQPMVVNPKNYDQVVRSGAYTLPPL
jgi:ABC-type sugar transport system substrate-binding protein